MRSVKYLVLLAVLLIPSVASAQATLTGTVDSQREVRAAVKNAYDGGAVGVLNQLETTR